MSRLADQLRRRQPPPGVRRSALQARTALRRSTSPLRGLPEFLIIGGQRCGTTSLYNYLGGHPSVRTPLVKEPHFFTGQWPRGTGWYRAQFALRPRRRAGRHGDPGRAQTFEATPYYLFHPCAPERAARVLPDAKLIVLLRDPVERAYSHYQHSVRQGMESMSFPEALALEETRLHGEEDRLRADSRYHGTNHRVFSYTSRGFYADQLERWLLHYPRESLLILRSEDLFADPAARFAEILRFLGLPAWSPAQFGVHTKRSPQRPADIPAATRQLLEERFAGANRRLEALLGRELAWSA